MVRVWHLVKQIAKASSLVLLDDVSRDHEICASSPCRNYLRTYLADSFQISVVACPGPCPQTFFWILNRDSLYFPDSGFIFLDFVFVFVNMGPSGSQNLKTLLLPQTAFQTFSEFPSEWTSEKYFFGFLTLSIDFSRFFFSFASRWDPMGAKTLNRYSSHKSLLNFPNFSWIFFSAVLTKVLYWIFKILSLRFLTIFFRQFKVHHYTLWINWKVRDRHVVTININRKPYMDSRMAPSNLTLNDTKCQS